MNLADFGVKFGLFMSGSKISKIEELDLALRLVDSDPKLFGNPAMVFVFLHGKMVCIIEYKKIPNGFRSLSISDEHFRRALQLDEKTFLANMPNFNLSKPNGDRLCII